MELNNIEKQIREKLNAREIQPTSQAWDRLDAMLSVAEEKKTKRSFGWLYFAASILVFVTVGTFLYNQEKQINSNIKVVNNDTINNKYNTNTAPIQQKIKEAITPLMPLQKVAQTEKSNPNTTTSKNKTIINQKTTTVQIQENAAGIINQKQEAITATNPKNEEITSPKAITVNPELLALASNEKSSSRVRVNANVLLSEVDSQSETLSFKGRVLKGVSKNYKEVKEAIASRNFEE